uniref:Uncharacterized protein n=1 Tax=Caenorhabditis japonica TaxID=281687 RepID=A0A8R1HIF6_CAEJA
MSSTPRSVLKKRPGLHDERRVSFAVPLSYEKEAPARKKQLPIPTSSAAPAAKKSKFSAEPVDIIMLSNQQNEVIESILDVESKFAKQSETTQILSNELTTFTESVAGMLSESLKMNGQLAEHAEMLQNAREQRTKLIEVVDGVCAQFQARISSQSQYSSCLMDLQKAISAVNCTVIDGPDDCHVDYDRLLSLVDHLEKLSGGF